MISGIVIDSSTNKPLKGVKLTSSNGDNPVTSTTDVNGKFIINVPSFPNNITISYAGYNTKEVKPFKGDGEIKNDLGVQQLTPLKQDISRDLLNSSQMSSSQVDSLLKSKKDVLVGGRKHKKLKAKRTKNKKQNTKTHSFFTN